MIPALALSQEKPTAHINGDPTVSPLTPCLPLCRTIDPDKAKAATLTLADLSVGQLVSGRVRRVESFGVFVDLAGCRTAGLAHVSELADGKVADVATLYRVGQAVRAKVGNVPTSGCRVR